MKNGHARLYRTNRAATPFLVLFRDPTRREKSGRAKRVAKWFGPDGEKDALAYLAKINETVIVEGTAGAFFDANIRADAQAARLLLDNGGHEGISLLHLAQRYVEQVAPGLAVAQPIAPQLEEFLRERQDIFGAAPATLLNLRTRCESWFRRAAITRVGDITRSAAEALRMREGVGAQTRRNDMNAISNFCSWLVEKRRLDHHPLLGMRRPKIQHSPPVVWQQSELETLFTHAASYRNGKCLATVAVLNFVGCRPSELSETRIFYGRHPVVRIEGGKLRGRANRTVPLIPAAVAWLRLAGSPSSVAPLHRYDCMHLCRESGLRWHGDICRHTFISNRLALVDDDAAVAREAGTSVEIIHRYYNRLRTTAEARAWAALRPAKN